MNSSLDFNLENKPLKELIIEANMYDAIKRKIHNDALDRDEKERRYKVVNVAELNTNIAIMYIYYKNDMLSDMFKLRDIFGKSSSDKTQMYIVDWGNIDQKNKFMSLICKMLSELSVDHIAATQEKTDLYHEITEFIDSCRKTARPPFLTDVNFWMLYFKFYDKYHER